MEDMGTIHLCAHIFYLIDILVQGVMAMKQETMLSEAWISDLYSFHYHYKIASQGNGFSTFPLE